MAKTPTTTTKTTVPWLKTFESNPARLALPALKAFWFNVWAWLGLWSIFIAAILIGFLLGWSQLSELFRQINADVENINPGLFLGLIPLVSLIVIVSAITAPAYVLVGLASAKREKIGPLAAIKTGLHKVLPLLGLNLLMGLIVALGLVALIIPGLLFIAWFSFAPYLLISQNKGIIEALKSSKALVKGRFFEVWGLLLATASVSLLGLIPAVGGVLDGLASILVSLAFTSAFSIRFLQLQELKVGDHNPTISGWNYAFIILGLVGSFVGNDAQNSGSKPTPNFNLEAPSKQS